MGCIWSCCPKCDNKEENYNRPQRPQRAVKNEQNFVHVVTTQNRSVDFQNWNDPNSIVRNSIDQIAPTESTYLQESRRTQNRNAITSQTNITKPLYKECSKVPSYKREWMLRNDVLELIRNEMPEEINGTFCKQRIVQLNRDSFEFRRVEHLFKDTTKGKNFQVIDVKRVENLELYAMYLLKKQELRSRFGYVEERLLFHGTKRKNVDEICENNFNWRLYGKAKGNLFGKGVSFSEIAFYASHYCEPEHSQLHTMFLVNVLQSRICRGKPSMLLPTDGYDTTNKPSTRSDKDQVVVKFEDHEFYPMYIIEFFKDNYNNKAAGR